MSEKQQIIACIEKEIEWCLNDTDTPISEIEKESFIKGLRQAIYLANRCVPEKTQLPAIAKLCNERAALRTRLAEKDAEIEAMKCCGNCWFDNSHDRICGDCENGPGYKNWQPKER